MKSVVALLFASASAAAGAPHPVAPGETREAVSADRAHARPVLPLPAKSPALVGVSRSGLERLHRFLHDEVRERRYPGAIVLVARRGALVDWRAFGHRDVAGTTPLERDAIVRIYSLTKIVTSVAVLMLADEGRLGLDDPLERHLPEFAALRVVDGGTDDAPVLRAPRRTPTLRHLLTHTSGFATGGTGVRAAIERLAAADLDSAPDLATYASRLAPVPLALDPGTRFDYDGVPTVVLGRVVEVVSGMPFDRFLAERVFRPLGMRDTAFEVPVSERARVVEMATTDPAGRLVPSPEFASREPGAKLNPYPSGAGGLYSTAADLVRFAQMLANGGELDGVRLLARSSVDELRTNQLPRVGLDTTEFRSGEGFGLGVAVVTDPARLPRSGSLGAYGWSGAASTWLTVDPPRGLIAILLAQHLPLGGPRDPRRLAVPFYNLAYSSLVDAAP